MKSTDIARIAGVSRSTVSRVINNYPNVPEETRERILEIIKQYNYVPDASARILAGIKNTTIGLFIIDIRPESNSKGRRIALSHYFSYLTGAIIEDAAKMGYRVLVTMINNSEMYKDVKQAFYNKTISGGIFIGQKSDDPIVKEIITAGYKVAIIDQSIESDKDIYSKCIVINSDNFSGAYNAIQYLINLKHSRIACITGELEKASALERLDGYKKALLDADIPVINSLIASEEFTENGGYRAVKKLLAREKPTAIFLGNDSMAIGAMKAIKEAGMKVPGDISIVGFDDVEISQYLNPPLTTVKMRLSEMASLAANSLITAIDKELNFSANYKVPVDLMIRESCTESK
ncbi:MAG: LacI family DNA-binding transcriptional regulator [Bacillota bacterium]|nr:LacI family DNA-binding transcriptional regulator [Bacillota bacterium]